MNTLLEPWKAVQVHFAHVLARLLHRLLDGQRDFPRLAVAEANGTLTVAHDGQGRESELPTTFDDLGHAINANQLFAQTLAANVARRHTLTPLFRT
jgi:hypothetical protein